MCIMYHAMKNGKSSFNENNGGDEEGGVRGQYVHHDHRYDKNIDTRHYRNGIQRHVATVAGCTITLETRNSHVSTI